MHYCSDKGRKHSIVFIKASKKEHVTYLKRGSEQPYNYYLLIRFK